MSQHHILYCIIKNPLSFRIPEFNICQMLYLPLDKIKVNLKMSFTLLFYIAKNIPASTS